MEQSQLLTQARFVFAPRVDSPPDGRDMLAKVQIGSSPLNRGEVQLQ